MPPKLTLSSCCGPACLLLPPRERGMLLLLVLHWACDQDCGRETNTGQTGRHAESLSSCPEVGNTGCGGPMGPRAAPIAVAAACCCCGGGQQRCCTPCYAVAVAAPARNRQSNRGTACHPRSLQPQTQRRAKRNHTCGREACDGQRGSNASAGGVYLCHTPNRRLPAAAGAQAAGLAGKRHL